MSTRAPRADRALAAARAVQELLEKGRAAPLPARGGLSQEQGEALIAEVRANRSDDPADG